MTQSKFIIADIPGLTLNAIRKLGACHAGVQRAERLLKAHHFTKVDRRKISLVEAAIARVSYSELSSVLELAADREPGALWVRALRQRLQHWTIDCCTRRFCRWEADPDVRNTTVAEAHRFLVLYKRRLARTGHARPTVGEHNALDDLYTRTNSAEDQVVRPLLLLTEGWGEEEKGPLLGEINAGEDLEELCGHEMTITALRGWVNYPFAREMPPLRRARRRR